MAKNTSLVPIWHKVINALNKAKLKYVLVGGAALIIHGLPRSTLDIDIYVPANEDTLNKLFQVMDALGLKSDQKDILNIRHFPNLFADQWICFSYNGEDVLDVFFADMNDFNKLYKNSILKKDKQIAVRVASLRDIASMKKVSGRPIDLSDIKLIEEAKRHMRLN